MGGSVNSQYTGLRNRMPKVFTKVEAEETCENFNKDKKVFGFHHYKKAKANDLFFCSELRKLRVKELTTPSE